MESCVGNERKQSICKKYYIKPVIHSVLLNGQVKDGCCGPLSDEYYTFGYKVRNSKEVELDYFNVGKSCAQSFLEIIRHSGLPIFNPLRAAPSIHGKDASGVNRSDRGTAAPINVELIQAINLLCISWGLIPKSTIADILDFTRKRPNIPNLMGVEIMNKIISKDKQERTLRTMIDELRVKNDIREFRFDLINEHLNSKKLKNYFG